MHFIRAFPIVLCLILLFSVFAFADFEEGIAPVLVTDTPLRVSTNLDVYIENPSLIPTYSYVYDTGSGYNVFVYSLAPNNINIIRNGDSREYALSYTVNVNGTKYYTGIVLDNGNQSVQWLLPVYSGDSQRGGISYVYEHQDILNYTNIFSLIKQFIEASNNWLSSIVRTVMGNPLLIFILLFYFVGTAIGLLFRFRRN